MSPKTIGNILYAVIMLAICGGVLMRASCAGKAAEAEARASCQMRHSDEECEMLIKIARVPQSVW